MKEFKIFKIIDMLVNDNFNLKNGALDFQNAWVKNGKMYLFGNRQVFWIVFQIEEYFMQHFVGSGF